MEDLRLKIVTQFKVKVMRLGVDAQLEDNETIMGISNKGTARQRQGQEEEEGLRLWGIRTRRIGFGPCIEILDSKELRLGRIGIWLIGPKIYQGQHYRWITSLILHLDFRHVLANMLLVVFLIAHLEHNYGTWRVLVVWILSSMGGNFLSAAFEDGCTMVVGASSAVFGFVGLFIADVVLNFESIGRPVLRIVGIGVFFVFFVITLVAESGDAYVSHFSHVGGLLCGLFPSVMFLPNVQDNRWRAARGFFRSVFSRVQSRIGSHREAQATLRRIDDSKSCWSKFPVNPLKIVGGAVLVFMFVFLPIYVYTVKLPSLKCEVEGEIDLSTVRILIS
eukprot:TRINITY_DN6854_c0_g2_i10.p2 TRINITY_DN6854_c0_g2~~TRINITY_DN6854_c0_g2_i10.p2  ORF type:complete len:334 (-),score=22.01 TRINITY_DN6854_c0_g2_i10:174-1175(-)